MTELPEFSDAPRRRGRPRTQETIKRDDDVRKLLGDGPRTKDELVEVLKLKPEHVYLSLWRLRKAGVVERFSDGERRHLWRLTA